MPRPTSRTRPEGDPEPIRAPTRDRRDGPRRRAGGPRRFLVAATTLALIVATAGRLLRDRLPSLSVLTYTPLVAPAAFALLLDLALRGRALPIRFGLSGVAAVVLLATLISGSGLDAAPPVTGPTEEVRLLHRNAWWGGGPYGGETWGAIVEELREADADVIVLSEAPGEDRMAALERALSEGWSISTREHREGADYWYRIAVLARAPQRILERPTLGDGVGLLVEIDLEPPMRLLAVDAPSSPWRDRRPFGDALVAYTRAQRRRGRPVEIIAGDLNAPSFSVAFDRLRGPFWLASDTCREWQGAWPRPAPFLDLDHVWVRDGVGSAGCDLYDPVHTDHRGHRVRLRRPTRP